MKSAWISILAACLFAGTVAASNAEQGQKLWYPTGEPELGEIPPPERIPYQLIPWEEYPEHTEELSRYGVVPITAIPNDSRPLQGCGFNFSYADLNRSFCVVGTDQTGFVVYADADGDGSLRDEAAIPLTTFGTIHTAEYRTTVTEEFGGVEARYPVSLRFVLLPPGDSERVNIRYMIQPWTYRRGVIHLEDRTIPFELRGSTGLYDAPSNAVWFDLNGDGEGNAGLENAESNEFFKVRDKNANIGDKSYRFEVDRYGHGLALIPLEERLSERPSLEPGTEAPSLQATGLDGNTQDLERYEGDLILLDFWYTTCGPCIKEAPKLAELHERYADEGFRILGVSPDRESAVRTFTKQYGHDWPQILESYKGTIHSNYRVIAYPTRFLIGRDGRIICGATGPGFWKDCWPKAEKVLNP